MMKKHRFRLENPTRAQELLLDLGPIGVVEGQFLSVYLPEILLQDPSSEAIVQLAKDYDDWPEPKVYWETQRFHCASIFTFSYDAGDSGYFSSRSLVPLFDEDGMLQATFLRNSWERNDFSGNIVTSGFSRLVVPATPLIRWYWHLVRNTFNGDERDELKELIFLLKD